MKRLAVFALIALFTSFPVKAVTDGGEPVGAGVASDVVLQNTTVRVGFRSDDALVLSSGRAAVRALETTSNSELAAVGIVLIPASIDDVTASCRKLSLMSMLAGDGAVLAAAKFSDPTRISDLDALRFPASELASLVKARAGTSDVKLSTQEISALRAHQAPLATDVFKNALLQRTAAWRLHGIKGLSTYSDKKRTIRQTDVTATLAASLDVGASSEGSCPVESFQYWSLVSLEDCKPVLQIIDTSVYISPGSTRIELVQLYASHYCDGFVVSIDLVPVPTRDGPATMMKMSLRAQVDMLGGMLGGIKRHIARSHTVELVTRSLERIRADDAWKNSSIAGASRD